MGETLVREPCPLENANKLELLSDMDILRDLSEPEIEVLMSTAVTRAAKKGTVLYGAEDGPEVLFLLTSGKVELYRRSEDGKKLTLAILEKGTFFGEMSLIGQGLLGTWAAALEDSVICALSRDDVQSLILDHPGVAFRLLEVIAGRLQQARDALQEMAFSDVKGRVAGLLLRLSDPGTNIVEGYSHEDLAAMVGCLRESFTVTLDRFKESQAVATGRRRIEITDRAQLDKVVNQRAGRAF